MQQASEAARDWAWEEFGHAALGDSRRTARLVRMAATIAEHPAGKVAEVFRTSAERQGAYDLLANDRVRSDAVRKATLARCAQHKVVHISVDGTSLMLTDRLRTKDFGAIGSTTNGARTEGRSRVRTRRQWCASRHRRSAMVGTRGVEKAPRLLESPARGERDSALGACDRTSVRGDVGGGCSRMVSTRPRG